MINEIVLADERVGGTELSDDLCWQALLARDRASDGRFVYGVRTTGVYCRPSCASRRPRRENVTFFSDAATAEQAGYRACRRCDPQAASRPDPQLELMERVCRYLEQPHERPPTLDELAAEFAVSPSHLQRTFRRLVGVSPRQYADTQRQARLRTQLREGDSVSGALFDAGYGSSGSFYARGAATLGMQPVRYRAGGVATQIRYAVGQCSLGLVLVAATERGVCAISLGDNTEQLAADLRHEFPAAELIEDDSATRPWVEEVLRHLEGNQPHLDLPLDIRATAFQRTVWEALRAIPYGSTSSYSEIAQAIGQPTAARAVAQACAHNPVALVVPCHRVVTASGEPGGYRWGAERKRAILAQEKQVNTQSQ